MVVKYILIIGISIIRQLKSIWGGWRAASSSVIIYTMGNQGLKIILVRTPYNIIYLPIKQTLNQKVLEKVY